MKKKKITTIENLAILVQNEFLMVRNEFSSGFSVVNKKIDELRNEILEINLI